MKGKVKYVVSLDASRNVYGFSNLREARRYARKLAADYGKTASNVYVQSRCDGTVLAHYRRSPDGDGWRWYWADLGVR